VTLRVLTYRNYSLLIGADRRVIAPQSTLSPSANVMEWHPVSRCDILNASQTTDTLPFVLRAPKLLSSK